MSVHIIISQTVFLHNDTNSKLKFEQEDLWPNDAPWNIWPAISENWSMKNENSAWKFSIVVSRVSNMGTEAATYYKEKI